MNKEAPSKKEICVLMAAGCLLGILCFVLTYGIKILDFTYDAWILNGGDDIKQHYIGFCHLRNNPLRRFPLGIISTLSKPFEMSVVYTDSIPLFALFFRAFHTFLPQHFQYFGLFGIMSFSLMGALSAVLIRRFSNRYTVCIGGSLFFILSFPVLQRMFYHTALAAQWIIVLALIIWVYTDITKVKTWIYWGLTGLLCVSIHSYFVFFTGLILIAQITEYYVINKKFDIKPLISVAVFAACPLFLLFLLGAFYGAGEVTKGGFGDFNGNLNGYINPDMFSMIFTPLKYNGMFEYEGFGYLGAGILLIIASAAACKIYVRIKNKEHEKIENDKTVLNSTRIKIMAVLVLAAMIISAMPRFSFNDIELLNIPLPAFVRTAFGICRTNGRFIWIGTYLIIFLALYFIDRHYYMNRVKALFVIAIALQLFDMSGTLSNLKETYSAEYTYTPVLSELDTLKLFDNKNQIVFMYDGGDLRMDTAFTAYLKKMSQNTFYYARPIDDEINEHTEQIKSDFLNGEISKRAIYIFRDEDYTEEFKNAVIVHGAVEYLFDGHVAVASK